ncbi:DUF1800 domain-containing protein [Catenuloplanes japonicus]|uniref:DUF1800 domain-containing protein n=1 Tax=Catenuloplanes japonicus TaxID=33876 RepID=UPI000525B712|nr:DUF1800 family protein [Catenuloplanes japonicus]
MSDGVALVMRRAGFGPTATELAAARQAGLEATVASLTAPVGEDQGAAQTPGPNLGADPFTGLVNPSLDQAAIAAQAREMQTLELTRWWMDRMTAANHQGIEKLVFFWHGHWATSIRKVIRPSLMQIQLRTLRASGHDVRDMAHRMVRDPALIYWLDNQLNNRQSANENLARELMELFLLGIGKYSEEDVKEAGRALTGWRIDYNAGTAYVAPQSYDDGTKSILGRTAVFDADKLVDYLLERPECPRFIATRLWYRYASSETPIPDSTREAMAAQFPDPFKMLGVLLRDEAFLGTEGQQVKQPVEWLIGAARQLGVRPGSWDEDTLRKVLLSLERLGQVPLAPPSVGGWPAGGNWLTPGTAQVRLALANRLVSTVQIPSLDPESLADLLAVDTWSDRTYAGLRGVTDPNRLLILGLISPEYVVT